MKRPPAWYVGLVAITGLQRLRELRVSARNLEQTGGQPAAPGSYPLMVAAHAALFVAPLAEVTIRGRRPRPAVAGAAVLVLAAATGLRWWSIASLGSTWNVRAAVPENMRAVTAGPYRWVRHPNYVAVALEFVALPLAGGAWVSAALLSLLNAGVLALRIPAEERLLEQSPGYRAAFAGKPRFVPRRRARANPVGRTAGAGVPG